MIDISTPLSPLPRERPMYAGGQGNKLMSPSSHFYQTWVMFKHHLTASHHLTHPTPSSDSETLNSPKRAAAWNPCVVVASTTQAPLSPGRCLLWMKGSSPPWAGPGVKEWLCDSRRRRAAAQRTPKQETIGRESHSCQLSWHLMRLQGLTTGILHSPTQGTSPGGNEPKEPEGHPSGGHRLCSSGGASQVGPDPRPQAEAFVIIWFMSPFSSETPSSVRVGVTPVFCPAMSCYVSKPWLTDILSTLRPTWSHSARMFIGYLLPAENWNECFPIWYFRSF